MRFRATVEVAPSTAKKINKYLHNNAKTYKECQPKDTAFTYHATFANGYVAEIKCCAPDFEENSDNTSWCEAVLLDKNGRELAVTEVTDEFFGEWMLMNDSDIYYVDVVEKTPVL